MSAIREIVRLDGVFKEYVGSLTCDWLGGVRPSIEVTYPRDGVAKVDIRIPLDRDVRQDDWRIEVRPAFAPTFRWAPHLAPTDGHVIDQHAFRAPALIVHDGRRKLAVVPDLDALAKAGDGAEADSPRWYMDLDAPANVLTAGLCATSVKEHVLFVREPGALFVKGQVEFGFYLFATEEPEAIDNPWRDLLAFFWERWGLPLYAQGQPVGGELEPYVRRAYQWAFKEWGAAVWQEFELAGKEVGAPAFIVNVTQSPNYPGPYSEREVLSVWNQAWFSSLRSAHGLFRYGKLTGEAVWIERANKIKELALSAPRCGGGFFPAVVATEMEEVEIDGRRCRRSKGWSTLYWGNSDRNPFGLGIREAPLHILDMSWTALLMLRWHAELESDERLVDYARTYADSLLGLQDERGYFPGWIDAESFQPCGVLDQSPETSLSVTLLLELSALTGEQRYAEAAYRAMDAVCEEIVPEGRWEDFETYWSCCRWGREWLGRPIERNGMYKQCNFSMYWTAEALLACYRSTGREAYLRIGRRCLDELLMTQAAWQPPYIHVPTLGGFGVMNADGEWNDARQSLFAELIVAYGMELGVDEYKERGVASMRASFALMYCPENAEVKRRWEEAWPFLNERDYGFMMENYGHGGRTSPVRDPMGEFTIFDWGNGAAAEGYLRMRERFGEALLLGKS